MGGPIRRLIAFACTIALAVAAPARGAVRLIEDEVYFTLRAPGASEVYLVGDFNNWNPTVEKMEQSGDLFQISLYLVEGAYRYKFVVDQKWVVDPDNPGRDPARGSPLVLVAKPAGLVLETESMPEEKAPSAVQPSFRYIVDLRWNGEGDDFESDQIIDLDVSVTRERLRGRALLKTVESSWDDSDGEIDITVDRGHISTEVASLLLTAFENDETWTSSDPAPLLGETGVYRYNAGYDRRGGALEYSFSEAIRVRGLYTDHGGGLPQAPMEIAGESLEAFVSGGGADTTVYVLERGVGDSDLLAFEAAVSTEGFELGYVTRRTRGMRPGLLADITRADSVIAATGYGTRENNSADMLWARTRSLFDLELEFGYGWASAEVQELDQSTGRLDPAGTLDLRFPLPAEAFEGEVEFETSDRFVARVGYERDGWSLAADWDRMMFDFKEGMYTASEATVDRVGIRAAHGRSHWRVNGSLRYTRQRYGDTPLELLVDSPDRNPWLDWRDRFSVADIVGIDTDAYTDVSAAVVWRAADSSATGTPRSFDPVVGFEFGAATTGVFERADYTSARLFGAYPIGRRFEIMVDGRVARYDRGDWAWRETFLCGYVEFGYRYRWVDLNLGWGFDPIVFDPVINDYQDIGRSETLRQSLAGGVRRGDGPSTGGEIRSLERRLESDGTIKLECIIRF